MSRLPILLVLALVGCFPFYDCPEHTGARDTVSVPAGEFERALDQADQLSDEACQDLCAAYLIAKDVYAVTECTVEQEPGPDTGGVAVLGCTWDGRPACG